MKIKNLLKWLILILCACVVTFNSCDKSNYNQNNRNEMKQQEKEKQKQEEKKKEEERKKEEEKKKQEEKQKEEEKKRQEEEARRKKEEEEKQLTLDPTSLKLTPMVAKNVNIKNGTAPYEVKVTNKSIALVKVHNDENFITVTGLNVGETEIVVTDKNMKTGKVTVTTR